MTSHRKSNIENWQLMVDPDQISRSISRLSYEILERDRDLGRLAIVGIRTAGEHIGRRIKKRIDEIEGGDVSFGVLDITLYRDDLSQIGASPLLKATDLPFQISGARVVLVDDVLYTGRTIRAALDAITDFGRPACVELAVLVDRGHRELPIRADYVGKNIPTSRDQFVAVRLTEDGSSDGVYVAEKNKKG